MSEYTETENNRVLNDIAPGGRGNIKTRVDCPLVNLLSLSLGWLGEKITKC